MLMPLDTCHPPKHRCSATAQEMPEKWDKDMQVSTWPPRSSPFLRSQSSWVSVGSERKLEAPLHYPQDAKDPIRCCQSPQDSFGGSEPSPIQVRVSMNRTCSNTSHWCCDTALLSQLNRYIVTKIFWAKCQIIFWGGKSSDELSIIH